MKKVIILSSLALILGVSLFAVATPAFAKIRMVDGVLYASYARNHLIPTIVRNRFVPTVQFGNVDLMGDSNIIKNIIIDLGNNGKITIQAVDAERTPVLELLRR